MLFGFSTPWPEPIGLPAGMTLAAPAFFSRRAMIGSSLHELRQVTSIDGRKVSDPRKAQEELARAIAAKDEQRPVRDGEVKPACAQACPADAMVFGDLTDPNSRVSKLAASRRAFRLLEELGTRPRVIYLKQEGE